MFKNILIPTDGSKLAANGVKAGVKLARSTGARVTGVYVVPPWMPPIYGEAAIYYLDDTSMKSYESAMKKHADKALGAVQAAARAAGVRCETVTVKGSQPWEGILKAAKAKKCDAISMTTHGRGGVGGLILGSETTRVLAHSNIPVLVTR